jgi:hypothetical protein
MVITTPIGAPREGARLRIRMAEEKSKDYQKITKQPENTKVEEPNHENTKEKESTKVEEEKDNHVMFSRHSRKARKETKSTKHKQ